MKFRKKPVVIEAMQWLGPDGPTSIDALIEWGVRPEPTGYWGPENNWEFGIPTLEGVMKAVKGDWIIRGVKGEFYPCKPDIFDATYEAVEEAVTA